MPQISFYRLGAADPDSRLQFACRLTEKARQSGHRVFILSDSASQATRLDTLLWEFKPSGFLPHALPGTNSKAGDGAREAVVVGTDISQVEDPDMLINLTAQPCQEHERFQRIDEILCADEQVLAAGRDSYRFYQSQGYQPQTHKL